ncbi:MAG TPA: shikimate kinase [Longimicrobiaceae bacterium]|nr:shikimate kinase [Longimicrobiaceae bacterium]
MPASDPSPGAVDRVVLVGFMCSGKTTVAAELARRLGWEHLDLDRVIEAREGRTVREIFREEGEARFRELEAEATAEVAARRGVVLAPGGGWITNPALLERLGPGTLAVWLRVSPETVVERAGPVREARPLLDVPDPFGAVRRLLAEREPLYRLAGFAVSTDALDPASVASLIENEIHTRGAAPRG